MNDRERQEAEPNDGGEVIEELLEKLKICHSDRL